jgi:hypothetical protein
MIEAGVKPIAEFFMTLLTRRVRLVRGLAIEVYRAMVHAKAAHV